MRAEAAPSPVGVLLREWRSIRGLSQLDLALSARVSSRHVSFIETGRSSPSRKMVLRLAETLDLPLRERNSLLSAAGFAALYRESELEHADLAAVRRALELVLRSHEPYPAFVLDSAWNVLQANRAHERFLWMLLPEATAVEQTRNVMRLVLDPTLLRPRVVNWELVAHVLGQRLLRQLRAPNLDAEQRRLFEQLLSYPGVTEALERVTAPPASAVLIPLEFELSGQRVSWFSTIATIGTPQDVTLQELQIESLFPADEETERLARESAERDVGAPKR